MIETGTILQDRYLIQKQIGMGGMGAVYLAVDRRFDNHVAIKETFYMDAEFGEAFEREANLLNGLLHPVLPHVSDYFSDDRGHFLVMQFIEGEDVSEILKREGAFPVEDVLRWTDSLLDALDYLHSQEPPIIHRDLKPQNLKLTPRGDIIILDFGLAKISYEDAPGVRSVFGYSRTYSPLEQIQGTGTDVRSDLFALGATVYHLLTGQPPVDAIMRASHIVAEKPDPLVLASEINKEIPSGVANVLNSALALNPDNRFVSAKALRQAFAQAVDPKLSEKSFRPSESPAKSVEGSDENNKNFSRIVSSSAFAAFASKEVDNPPAPVEADLIEFKEFLPQKFAIGSHRPQIAAAAEDIPSQNVKNEEVTASGAAAQESEARELAVEKDTLTVIPSGDNKTQEIVPEEHSKEENAAQKTGAVETQKAKSSGKSSSNQKFPAGKFQPAARSAGYNFRQSEPADILTIVAYGRKQSRAPFIALLILPVLFALAAGVYLFKNSSAVHTIQTSPVESTNREPDRNSARSETISETFLPENSGSPAAEKREEARTMPNPAKKSVGKDELAGATVNKREIKENPKPEPAQNEIKPSAATSEPARSKLSTRERIVSEPVPDIESVFSGRSSRERDESESRTQDVQSRRPEKMSEEQKLRERQRERRRRNNKPLPF